MNSHRPPSYSKIKFILTYVWWKVSLLWEVQSPRWAFFAFEFRYSIANFIRGALKPNLPMTVWSYKTTDIHTSLGNFKVRPGTQDAAIISPGFERQDFNELVRLMEEISSQQKVLFLDIGANIGKFSASILQQIPNKNLMAVAFEPIQENRELLVHNLKLNQVDHRCRIIPHAISNFEGRSEIQVSSNAFGNSSMKALDKNFDRTIEISVTTLDSLNIEKGADILVLKIDVEGSEAEALLGGEKWLKEFKMVYLMLEDTLWSPQLEAALNTFQAQPIKKLSPYNSWWIW